MAADTTADIRLSTLVTRIEHDDDGAQVYLESGEALAARYVVVTLPQGALGAIEVSPALSAAKQQAAKEGQTTEGIKLWIKVRGKHAPFAFMGDPTEPLTFGLLEYADEDSYIVAFGPRAADLDGTDIHAVAEALHRYRPDLEVLDVTAHDWVADPLAGETWPCNAPAS